MLLGNHRPHERVHTELGGASLTKQSMAAETNINSIMSKFQETGLLTHVAQFQGQYGNYLSATDYHTAITAVVEAQEMFETLPSSIRARFGNSPEAFLAFVENPENQKELVALGLASRRGAEDEPTPGAATAPVSQPEGAETPQDTSSPSGENQGS